MGDVISFAAKRKPAPVPQKSIGRVDTMSNEALQALFLVFPRNGNPFSSTSRITKEAADELARRGLDPR